MSPLTPFHIVDYTVCESLSGDGLSDQVRKLITQGWEPYGHLLFQKGYQERFIQAMVKYQDSEAPR